MKFRKCWFSSSLAVAVLASIIASAYSEQGEAETMPKLDATVFDKAAEAEKQPFSAEASRLLNILANSVYTDRKATIREIVSNSVDAIDKQHKNQLEKANDGNVELDNISNYSVKVEVDKENGILSFTDNGIGMTNSELKSFLGTIAKSGTAEFASGAKKGGSAANMIGQFGVGFYSVLLISDKVVVISKSDNDPKQWIWETDASASFRIVEDPSGPTLKRGTRVMLKLKSDASEFLDPEYIEKVLKEYFRYDRHQIYLVKPKTITEEVEEVEEKKEEKEAEGEQKDDAVEVEEEKKDKKPKTKKIEKVIIEDVLVSQSAKPIWHRNPSDVKPEEYEALYKTISGDKNGKPIAYTHFSGETARSESFRAILFIPERPPFSPFSQQEHELDLKLHVRGVFVTAKFEDFVPKYLSFIKGVIDSDDLSLNISREILQNTSELRGIRKKIVKKIIEMMNELTEDKAKYKKFYDSYGSFIKMEISEREDNRTLLSKLLRYRTTKSGEDVRSLDEYVENMPEAQKKKKVIYYLAGKAGEVEKSPFLGRFTDKGYEVILMTEPVDEHTIQRVDKYDDFKFENIAKDGIKLDDDEDKEIKEYEEKYKTAKVWLDKSLKDIVEKVNFVSGPVNVPGSFKSSQFGWTGNMERLITAQSSVKDDPMMSFFSKQKKILELNPKNPLVHEILERANAGKATKELKATLRVLTDSMMIWSGYAVRDTSVFAKNVDRLVRGALELPVEALVSEPEEEEKKDKDSDLDEDLSLSSLDLEKSKEEDEKSGETKESGKSEESGKTEKAKEAGNVEKDEL